MLALQQRVTISGALFIFSNLNYLSKLHKYEPTTYKARTKTSSEYATIVTSPHSQNDVIFDWCNKVVVYSFGRFQA